MSSAPIELTVITASIRPGRLGPAVAAWFLGEVEHRDSVFARPVDLADLDLAVDLSPSRGTEVFETAIASADAIVIVTPEYNHGYPASLKIALDSVKDQWRGKPIGFVSYGGLAGGVRATEQLRQVAAELHMVSVRDSVAVPRVRKVFADNNPAVDGAVVDAASRMIDQLCWWATATRSMRGTNPYPGQ